MDFSNPDTSHFEMLDNFDRVIQYVDYHKYDEEGNIKEEFKLIYENEIYGKYHDLYEARYIIFALECNSMQLKQRWHVSHPTKTHSSLLVIYELLFYMFKNKLKNKQSVF
ncbi:hypothetical protein EHP00_2168 [Ecytonucleospora hepatopenaei]|uniref:Uncharacterized protein n=1 Tax=Ecytonucleospora hepatopenaei TaxID=646526 RepID=A0A1W0E5B1_9MICR|nr:hypothetical protein EHP00_2168 [Ecytonucleospora hepatopenaei]